MFSKKTSSVMFTAVLSVILCGTSTANLSTQECTQAGFNSHTLLCESCEMLDKFSLSKIKDTCLECCKEREKLGDGEPVQKYPKATLEVCWCKFPQVPQVEAFVKSERPDKFPNLKVRHVDGAWPVIHLENENGLVEQTLSITKWDTDTIEEFLRTYLL